ncbi:MAG: CRISPR-associated endonuclease Cas2 [Planctomycetes bacterium]|nr:CRISPR-associated endonuclease Cas2 [Planctomycetota bacterium]
MQVLVTYDVSTTSKEGRRRLRRVAQVYLDFGQRVQKSVFECTVDPTGLARLRQRLLAEIDEAEDSLRVYRLHGAFEEIVENYGHDGRIDYEGPLIA